MTLMDFLRRLRGSAGREAAGGEGNTNQTYNAPVGSVYNQQYNQPVGSVYNAETINVVAASGTAPLSDRELLAPALIDRGEQIDPLIDRLTPSDDAAPAGSMLAILPGCASDMHQAFVMRCGRIELQSLTSTPWQYLQLLPWPQGTASVDAVVRGVRDALALPRSLNRAQTEGAVAALQSNLCFSHKVDGACWTQDDGALIRQWVDYLLADALVPAEGFIRIGFLCVELGEEHTPGCARLLSFLDELRRNQSEQGLLVMPALDWIRRRHLDEWVGTASRFLGEDLVEASLIDLPEKIFETDAKEKRFSPVYTSVRAFLPERMRRQPSFRGD